MGILGWRATYLNVNGSGFDGAGDVVPQHGEEQGEGLRVGGADPVEDSDHVAETLKEMKNF